MHIGNELTSASTGGALPDATEKTRPAPQSETHNGPSRERGESPNTMPSISTATTGTDRPTAELIARVDGVAGRDDPDAAHGRALRARRGH